MLQGLEKELGMTPRGGGQLNGLQELAAPEGNQPQQLEEGLGAGQERTWASES